jgi:hypothetical protein
MGKYVLVYKGGGMPQSEEEQKQVMEAWGAWFGSLGESVVDMGNPFGPSRAIGGGAASGLTGYSILAGDSLDDAATKAESCPIIEGGGSVEVYEAVDMSRVTSTARRASAS